MPSLTLRTGAFVRLKGQPKDLPDFLVERCHGDRCWIRQQTWGPNVQLKIKVTQIEIPEDVTSQELGDRRQETGGRRQEAGAKNLGMA